MTEQEKDAIAEQIRAAIKTFMDSEPLYQATGDNGDKMRLFMSDPQVFGYYVVGGKLCYTRDGDTPSKRLAKAEAEFETAKRKFRPGHPRYQEAETKLKDLRQKAETSLARLPYTVGNLRAAFQALMAGGYLDTNTQYDFNWTHNVDPNRVLDDARDRMPTKSIARQSAAEFARNFRESPKFRAKINGEPETPQAPTDKQLQDGAIREWLNGLSSSDYQNWLNQDSKNFALVESLG